MRDGGDADEARAISLSVQMKGLSLSESKKGKKRNFL